MINNSTREKIYHFILAIVAVAGIYVILGCCFDFYYDLNDDVLIKDILSGAYTGHPDGHTNQLLYPLGLFLSGLYHLFPKASVFGGFLCLCFGGCFFMILYRMQDFFKNRGTKIIVVFLLPLVFLALMMQELVFVQYSVVCGVMAGTACFWFYTTKTEVTVKEFWKQNLWALVLVWLAFLIRSEMLLLTTPFLAVVGIWHWAEAVRGEEEKENQIERKKKWQLVLSKQNVEKYVCFVLVFVLGLAILSGFDRLAYESPQWKQYRAFFDARTRVYDFTWYPAYESGQEFYEENGIRKIQYRLIDNYNFGLDETITENTLEIIASYHEKERMWGSLGNHIKNTLWELGKRSFSVTDAPYICFVWAGYGLVFGLMVLQKEKRYIGKLILLFLLRSIPWFYLIFSGRVVDRIAHPLYVIEVMILFGILGKQLYDRPLWNPERYYRMLAAAILGLLAFSFLPFGFESVKKEQSRREEILENQKAFSDYAKENPQNYYYLDVYSTVDFIEKMFENVDNSKKNYDILGGWMCHSPLQKEASGFLVEDLTQEADENGLSAMALALLQEGVYFVVEAEGDVTFLEDFYKAYGKEVKLQKEETIGQGENPFCIYRVVEETKENR